MRRRFRAESGDKRCRAPGRIMRRGPAQHQDAARPQAKTRALLDQLALLKAVRLSTVVFFDLFVLFPSRHGELEREYVVLIGRSSYNFLGSSWLFSHAKPLESSWGEISAGS